MTNTAGPLGRESMHFRDKMLKYHAEIERMVYAAEDTMRWWIYAEKSACAEQCQLFG
jgi:hypothetical protein